MIVLRSALFNLFFFGTTFLLTIPASGLSLFAPQWIMSWARFWARMQIGAVRVICGVRYQISGWENLPDGPVLMAARHESTFDVLIWLATLPAACFVVKRELAEMPLFGRCIHATGMISVDREAGATALRALLRGGDRAKSEGRHIIIFPEGTRVDPFEHPPLQPGVAALASRTHLPVIPVMTNSGQFWGRRAFRKQPGTIRILIQPRLPSGYGREAILEAISTSFDDEMLQSESAEAIRPLPLV